MRGLLRGNPVIRGFRDFSEHTCYTAIERGDKKRLHIQCLSEQPLMRQHLRNVLTLLNSTMSPPTILVVSTRVHPAQSAHSSQEDQSGSQRARTSLGTWEGRHRTIGMDSSIPNEIKTICIRKSFKRRGWFFARIFCVLYISIEATAEIVHVLLHIKNFQFLLFIGFSRDFHVLFLLIM